MGPHVSPGHNCSADWTLLSSHVPLQDKSIFGLLAFAITLVVVDSQGHVINT